MTELPTTFGKYYLTEKLATGGMAEIYLAKLIGPGGFEKQLVIKQIHPKLTGERHFVDLFVTEAKTLVTLAHGNIVPVYELGVVDETYFIAMDYIDGPTLYRLTETMAGRDARMDPALAAWITARILEGLDYAHRKGEGVIHRDLSPRNVMMSRDGEVKLVDFGIAVTLGEPGETEASQSAPTGSFPYMSPEQVRREPLTGQTDLFSVGVLFWEMLVGHRLFARPDPDATLAAVLREEIPRPSSVRPEVPPRLDDVVMRALERDQGKRWPDASEMLAALNRYLYSLDATPTARDVAAIVAKFCPAQTRRLPTHLEALAQDAVEPSPNNDQGGPTMTPGALPEEPPPRAAGPRTAVILRDVEPKGKRAQRQQTFATHVDLKGMLEGSTPMFGVEAIAEPPAPAPTPTTVVAPRKSQPEIPVVEPRPGVIAPKLGVPGREAPRRGTLIVAGIGAIALSLAAVYLFYRGRDRVLAAGDGGVSDAASMSTRDAGLGLDDAPTDATQSDAGNDASVRTRADASLIRPMAADGGSELVDPPRPSGTGTLKIGADPWGKVYVDGKLIGITPRDVSVSAGHHTIEIMYDPEPPGVKKTFSIDLDAGETKPINADFH
jgi:serine/threonine-protein kinase